MSIAGHIQSIRASADRARQAARLLAAEDDRLRVMEFAAELDAKADRLEADSFGEGLRPANDQCGREWQFLERRAK